MQLHPTRSGAHLAIASIAVVAVGVIASEAALVGWGGAVLVGVAIARAATLVSVARIRAAGFEMLWTGTQRVARTQRGSTVQLGARAPHRRPLGVGAVASPMAAVRAGQFGDGLLQARRLGFVLDPCGHADHLGLRQQH